MPAGTVVGYARAGRIVDFDHATVTRTIPRLSLEYAVVLSGGSKECPMPLSKWRLKLRPGLMCQIVHPDSRGCRQLRLARALPRH